MRFLFQAERSFGDRRWIAYLIRDDAKLILACRQVGVTGNATGSRHDPVLVESLQAVAEAYVLLGAQQQGCEGNFQTRQGCREYQGGRETQLAAIGFDASE